MFSFRTVAVFALSLFAFACVPHLPAIGAPVIPPIRDHQIVRNQRIGMLSLGMSEADLLKYCGQPTHTLLGTGAESNWARYDFAPVGALSVTLLDGRVNSIQVSDPSYAMPNGVHPGSTALEVRALLGTPSWQRLINSTTTLCYDDGTQIQFGSPDIIEHHDSNLVAVIGIRTCVP